MNLLLSIDRCLSAFWGKFVPERNSLIIVLLHSIFIHGDELASGQIDPQQSVTVNDFQEFVHYFQSNHFTFVSPDDILTGLYPDKNYLLITFDDGYFNNSRILPFLEKMYVPALFFISTRHVLEHKCFWWDVVYRERKRSGISPELISRECEWLSGKIHSEIEAYLESEFGTSAIVPQGDLDRPFTAAELQHFARHPLVSIGNHTRHHAILTNYDEDGIYGEMMTAQEDLQRLFGVTPDVIAYPSGRYNSAVIRCARRAGFRLGITTIGKKNFLPLDLASTDALCLNRFILWGGRDIPGQCRYFRANVHLYESIREIRNRRRYENC